MNIYFTFDYELFFGEQSGTAQKCIIEPVNALRKIADQYNVKFVFFIDSGYLIKLQEYKEKYNYVQKEYDLVFQNIKELYEEGHDIQLHIHPHWEDSYYDGYKWIIDTRRYRLQGFSQKEIDNIVYRYKKILTDIVGDSVFAYRAGGWCIQPFDKISKALKKHNIWLDSTAFYGGYNKSKTHFYDFRDVPQKDMWKFEKDIIEATDEGSFTEIPISSIRLTPLFFWQFAFTKKFAKGKFKIFGDGKPVGASKKDILKMLTLPTYSCVSCDGYKSKLLQKTFNNFKGENFVIIGHPKAQCKYSLDKLDEFVKNQKEYINTFEGKLNVGIFNLFS